MSGPATYFCVECCAPGERRVDPCHHQRSADTLPTPIENLLPLALRRAFMQDAIVNAAFHRAAQRNVTREQALIDTVLLLSEDRQRLHAEMERVMREQAPPIILIRDNPRSITIDGDTFVPEDAGTRGPEDADPHVPSVAKMEDITPELVELMGARPYDDTSRCRICGRAWPCPDEMKHAERDWFFTFGSGHTYHGESLARAFVRFHGTALEARRKMYEVFGTAFSHQYATEEEAGVAQFGLTELKLEATDG
jgi:hypothetical protein